jgi:hypothetical protein
VGDLDDADDDGLLIGSLEDVTTLRTLVGSDEEGDLVGSDDVGDLGNADDNGLLIGSLEDGTKLGTLEGSDDVGDLDDADDDGPLFGSLENGETQVGGAAKGDDFS